MPPRRDEHANLRSDAPPPRLYVLEGPDGVGKSELGRQVVSQLLARGVDVLHTAFPGNHPGTLGKLVYDIHHNEEGFGLEQLSPAALQLLHLAAHVDAIETRILPAIRRGTTVVLDRYWWSMEAYGSVGKVRQQFLSDMVALERAAWDDVCPSIVFLVDRDEPLRPEPMGAWRKVRAAYRRIADRETALHAIVVVDNRGTVEEATTALLNAIVGPSPRLAEGSRERS